MWHCVQIGVKIVSWISWKSDVQRRTNRNRLTVLRRGLRRYRRSRQACKRQPRHTKNPFAARKLVELTRHADLPRRFRDSAWVTRGASAVPCGRPRNDTSRTYSARLSRRIVSNSCQLTRIAMSELASPVPHQLRRARRRALLASGAGKTRAGAGTQARCGVVWTRQSLDQPDRAGAAEDAQLPAGGHRHRHAVEGRGMEEEIRTARQAASTTTRPCIAWPTNKDIDIVYVVTPNALHLEHALGRGRRGQTRVLREAAGDHASSAASRWSTPARRPASC